MKKTTKKPAARRAAKPAASKASSVKDAPIPAVADAEPGLSGEERQIRNFAAAFVNQDRRLINRSSFAGRSIREELKKLRREKRALSRLGHEIVEEGLKSSEPVNVDGSQLERWAFSVGLTVEDVKAVLERLERSGVLRVTRPSSTAPIRLDFDRALYQAFCDQRNEEALDRIVDILGVNLGHFDHRVREARLHAVNKRGAQSLLQVKL